MKEHNTSDPIYVLGDTEQETRRLQIQGQLFEPFTRRIFETAGITTGMKVLDVGCGAGDVSILAAKMVGPNGSVVGVDRNPAVVETARQRIYAAGLSNVSFVTGDIREVVLDNDFDAVLGRLVLLYIQDKASALGVIAQHLRPGGIFAFHEVDFTLTERVCSDTTSPQLIWQFAKWMLEVFRLAGSDPHIGRSLSEAFLQAGLPQPNMFLDGLIGQGPEWIGYDYLVDTLRSALPLLLQFGVTTEQEIDIETFAKRLRAEALRLQSPIICPVMIGAWIRKVG